ncbi:MAG: glycosyltransferase family 39 protein [Bryobacteraceae bacterium]
MRLAGSNAIGVLARRPYWVIALVSAVLAYIQATRHALESVDEGLYAQISKEMALGGDWLTMHWTGQPWFGKPPLFMWLVAVSYRFLGVSEFASRLPSALLTILLVCLIFATARRVANQRTAWIAVALACTSPTILKQAVFCTTDIVVAAALMAAIYIHLRHGARGFTAVSLCFSAAYMAKSAAAPVAFVGLAPFVLYALWRDRPRFWTRLFAGAALAAAVILPWHLIMYGWYGNAFLEQNLGYHVLKRVTADVEGNGRGPSYYFWALGYYFTSQYVWLLPMAAATIWTWKPGDAGRIAPLAASGLVILAVITLMTTKLFWYLFPAIPPLVIVAAYGVDRVLESRNALALALLAAAFGLGLSDPVRVSVLAAAAAGAGLAAFLFRQDAARAAVAGAGVVLFGFAAIRTANTIASHQPLPADMLARLAGAARKAGPDDRNPAFVAEGRTGMAWTFYTGRAWCAAEEVPAVAAEFPAAQLDKCLETNESLHVMVPERLLARVESDPRVRQVEKVPGFAYLRFTRANGTPAPAPAQ